MLFPENARACEKMNYINDTVKAVIGHTVQETVEKKSLLVVNGETFKKQMKN
jgi:hypothetical protein